MKSRRRSTLIIALLVMVLASVGTSAVQAGSPYYWRYTAVEPFLMTCSSSGSTIFYSGSAHVLTEDILPENGRMLRDFIIAGQPTQHSEFLGPDVNSAVELFSWHGFRDDLSYPFHSEVRFLTVVNGQPVYRSTVLFTCTGDGTFPVTITNEDLTIGSSSAIHDGRINGENYAPVALYCDGSVLNAYKIDSTSGTFAWTLDLASDSTDTPLVSGLGIALSKTEDGRFSLLAPQSDGKQYLFIFDGCPSPGATETYISDPVTGEFVHTE